MSLTWSRRRRAWPPVMQFTTIIVRHSTVGRAEQPIVPSEKPAAPPPVPSPRDGHAASGEALFLANLGLIDRVIGFVCRRYSLNTVDGQDFASHARLELMRDQYAILRKFQ